MAVSHSEATFFVTDFPKVKLLWGNFYGFTKEQMITTHDSCRGTFYGLISYEILRTIVSLAFSLGTGLNPRTTA